MFKCDICSKFENEYEDALWCEDCKEEYYSCRVCSLMNTLGSRIVIHNDREHKSVNLF